MSPNSKLDLTKMIMAQIKKGQIKIKPKWYFVLSSLAMIGGLFSLIILSIFLVSLTVFSLRTHGPMGSIRYQQLISHFPWWALLGVGASLSLNIWLFKRRDFSYKKNFTLIILSYIISILIAGWLVDYFELDNFWMRRGPMPKLYQQYNGGQKRTPSFWQAEPRGSHKNQELNSTHQGELKINL